MKYFTLTILSALTIIFSACDSVESLGLATSSDDATVANNQKLEKRITELEKQNEILLKQNKQLLEQNKQLEKRFEETLTVKSPENTKPNDSVKPSEPPQPEEPDTCTLNDGQIVQHGWSGKGRGSNSCNQCQCINGALACTKMACQDNQETEAMNEASLTGKLFAPITEGSDRIPVKITLPVGIDHQRDLPVWDTGWNNMHIKLGEEEIGKVSGIQSLTTGSYGMTEVDYDNPVLLIHFEKALSKSYPANTSVTFYELK